MKISAASMITYFNDYIVFDLRLQLDLSFGLMAQRAQFKWYDVQQLSGKTKVGEKPESSPNPNSPTGVAISIF